MLTKDSVVTDLPSQDYLQNRLDNAPNLSLSIADCIPLTILQKPSTENANPVLPLVPKCSLPQNAEVTLNEDLTQGLAAKEVRELHNAAGMSNQFHEDKGEWHNTIPWQRANDKATFQATIDKRLTIKTQTFNKKRFNWAIKKELGWKLFQAFKKVSCIPDEPVPFDYDCHLDCINAWLTNRVKKTVKTLANIDSRGDPDTPINWVDLFLKSQKKLKDEAFRTNAKAGQTIISMHTSLLAKTGPMARYLTRKVGSFTPEHQIIYSETSPQEFEDWVLKYWDFDQISLESDFAAFDKSQNEEFLWFEIFLARHFNYPKDELDLYVSVKLNTRLYLGVLACMRLTGEGPTFAFNTFCGKAYLAYKFNLGPSVRMGSSGDDTIVNGIVKPCPDFLANEKRFKIESKEFVVDNPTLCGWKLSRFGIWKSIRKLYVSMHVQAEADNLRMAAPSYALEHHFFYKKAELLIPFLTDPADLERAQWLTRTFVLMHHPLYNMTGQRRDYVIERDLGSDYYTLKFKE